MRPENLIQQAIEDAVRQDDQSNPHKRLLTTSERNIASHIRASIEAIIRKSSELTGYQVDVEYNRQGEDDDPKTLDGGNVVPDILIHKRGVTFEEDASANYLYMEVKVINRFNGTRDSIRDRDTTEKFRHDKHKLRLAKSEKQYKHAAFLIFDKNGECFLEIDNDIEYEDSFKDINIRL